MLNRGPILHGEGSAACVSDGGTGGRRPGVLQGGSRIQRDVALAVDQCAGYGSLISGIPACVRVIGLAAIYYGVCNGKVTARRCNEHGFPRPLRAAASPVDRSNTFIGIIFILQLPRKVSILLTRHCENDFIVFKSHIRNID